MTNLHLIAEPTHSDWRPGMERPLLQVSQGRGRLPGRGNRLSLLVYTFLALALCLLLTDLFHLAAESGSPEQQAGMTARVSNAHHNAGRSR